MALATFVNDVLPPEEIRNYEYPNGDELPEPENIDDIKRVLEQPRKSLSPSRFSKEEFKKFKRADAHATKESRVVATVIPIIEGDAGDPRGVASDVAFSNLDHLTDGSLVCAKPDLYYGARPEQWKKEVREALSNFIVPSTQDDLLIAPNNFLEVKGPDGSLSVATRQATYNAALGSRALHALQSYGMEQIHDNKAYTLTWTYHGGHLKAYASHPIPPSTPGMQSGYAMTQVNSWSLTGNVDIFRQGAAAYRNGRDWAKLQRDQAIAQANKIAPMPTATTDTSEDELSLEFAHPPKRSRSPEKHDSTMNAPTTAKASKITKTSTTTKASATTKIPRDNETPKITKAPATTKPPRDSEASPATAKPPPRQRSLPRDSEASPATAKGLRDNEDAHDSEGLHDNKGS
ncbi:hypothetical protein B0I35DRAFT_453500 [Stachybotrys elegans]|uniref:Uncharacterized protein n=1 Tax=Stachybotrys elegans TaxID=80388 RepID=A0A8K0WMC1_9HYPO|nr:hypothetical protein B0I35DRAFT_453500 [Stachybotrys elegans]